MNISPAPRKRSSSLLLLAACAIGAAIGLFGLNFYHSNRCSGQVRGDGQGQGMLSIEEQTQALEKRVLEAESQVRGAIIDEGGLW